MKNSHIFVLHKVVKKNPSNFDEISFYNLKEWVSVYHKSMPKLGKKINLINPDWKILLTFDDGYESDLVHVARTLVKYKVNAIFFIVSSFIGKKGHLSKNQLEEIIKLGFTIGSHSKGHFDLSSMKEDHLCSELTSSRKTLEEILNINIKHFAFPYGLYPKYFKIKQFKEYSYYFSSKPGIFSPNDKVFKRNSLNSMSDLNSIQYIVKSLNNRYSIYILKYHLKEMIKFLIPLKLYRILRQLI